MGNSFWSRKYPLNHGTTNYVLSTFIRVFPFRIVWSWPCIGTIECFTYIKVKGFLLWSFVLQWLIGVGLASLQFWSQLLFVDFSQNEEVSTQNQELQIKKPQIQMITTNTKLNSSCVCVFQWTECARDGRTWGTCSATKWRRYSWRPGTPCLKSLSLRGHTSRTWSSSRTRLWPREHYGKKECSRRKTNNCQFESPRWWVKIISFNESVHIQLVFTKTRAIVLHSSRTRLSPSEH